MLREAGELAASLKQAVAAMKHMKDSNAAGVGTLTKLLLHPLPRIHEDAGGSPYAARHSLGSSQTAVAGPGQVAVGGEVDVEALQRAPREAASQLEQEVLGPLGAWLALYDSLVQSNRELDQLRLLVDSRRRTVADLTVKDAAMRAKVQRSTDPKVTGKAEEAAKLLEHKTAKLASTYDDFVKAEAELHTRLVGLVSDAAYVKVHVAQGLANLGGALLAVGKIVETPPIPEVAVVPGGGNPAASASQGMATPGAQQQQIGAQGSLGGGYDGVVGSSGPGASPNGAPGGYPSLGRISGSSAGGGGLGGGSPSRLQVGGDANAAANPFSYDAPAGKHADIL